MDWGSRVPLLRYIAGHAPSEARGSGDLRETLYDPTGDTLQWRQDANLAEELM